MDVPVIEGTVRIARYYVCRVGVRGLAGQSRVIDDDAVDKVIQIGILNNFLGFVVGKCLG